MILPYLLHTANRNIKDHRIDFMSAFYLVKDKILSKYGRMIGYDVQHIAGKKCNSCGGKGQHPKYGYNGKIYDWADCYHCWGGWYKFPIWVALSRIKFGRYVFHKPLKREERIGNPFTKESLGWEVSDSPIIKGYIDHNRHWLGDYAIYILFVLYDRKAAKEYISEALHWRKVRLRNRLQYLTSWSAWIMDKPSIRINYYYDDEFENDDLPF